MRILLNKWRTEKRITLENLAEQTGISKSALNNFENDKTSPTMRHMERLAKALEVKITDLFESKYK